MTGLDSVVDVTSAVRSSLHVSLPCFVMHIMHRKCRYHLPATLVLPGAPVPTGTVVNRYHFFWARLPAPTMCDTVHTELK